MAGSVSFVFYFVFFFIKKERLAGREGLVICGVGACKHGIAQCVWTCRCISQVVHCYVGFRYSVSKGRECKGTGDCLLVG